MSETSSGSQSRNGCLGLFVLGFFGVFLLVFGTMASVFVSAWTSDASTNTEALAAVQTYTESAYDTTSVRPTCAGPVVNGMASCSATYQVEGDTTWHSTGSLVCNLGGSCTLQPMGVVVD